MTENPKRTQAEQDLLDSLDGLRDKYEDRTMIVFELDLIIEHLEEEFSNQDWDYSHFADCPKCGNPKDTKNNYCPRCGWITGFCKHDETAYRQDGKLFCLKCKRVLRYTTEIKV